jgi:hypothetical protein
MSRYRRTYVGIDNGVTGTIGIIHDAEASIYSVPTVKVQDYTKKRKSISRVNTERLERLLRDWEDVFILLERPMTRPGRYNATISAARCLEATLIVLDRLKIPYQFCDSKEWQRVLLPKHSKDADLKKLSLQVGKRLFPGVRWRGHFKDADGLLIAEWARRCRL